jgi:4-amino-4-deoxy-L-arabinose transferase-like glycosyltransferase
MMMSYMGALKGWIYGSLLAVFEPTAATIRLPLLLLAALTIAATYRLATELFDRLTGLVAMLLVATDPIFLLTSRMNWGPVVIQRLCLVMGVHLIFTGSSGQAIHPRAIVGAFLFGVALFDKLTFIWIVFGLLAAFLLTYRKQLLSLLRYKLLPSVLRL